MKVFKKIDQFNESIGRFCGWLALFMTLLAAINTFLRYLGAAIGHNLISNAYTEMQWYLFSAIFLLAASRALKFDKHVRVDVIYGRLDDRKKNWIDLIGSLIFLLPFCAFAVWASWNFVLNSWSEWSADAGGLPRFPVKVLIPLSFVLLGLQGLCEITKKVRFLFPGDPDD